MVTKLKLVILTMEQKLQAIFCIDAGETLTTIAKDLGVGKKPEKRGTGSCMSESSETGLSRLCCTYLYHNNCKKCVKHKYINRE